MCRYWDSLFAFCLPLTFFLLDTKAMTGFQSRSLVFALCLKILMSSQCCFVSVLLCFILAEQQDIQFVYLHIEEIWIWMEKCGILQLKWIRLFNIWLCPVSRIVFLYLFYCRLHSRCCFFPLLHNRCLSFEYELLDLFQVALFLICRHFARLPCMRTPHYYNH